MLAERVRSSTECIEKMNGIAAAEYKLDGERIQVHKGKGKVELFSRSLEKITIIILMLRRLSNLLRKVKRFLKQKL